MRQWMRARRRGLSVSDTQAGMTTAEYALGTLAAAGFGAVLYKVVTSDAVSGALQSVIAKALDVQF
ncbi:DUF4244 domain-containing protein [Streptomyces zingiberis]|uniref:DUF4244 domain-containing protein n=1 Tax=Streptomyces zingiberis TaxID=2053010 RepID=A0ABX1BMU2_9ACTN|nr:DUF4244 domain-containing protein [Streptomyces zingiberis]NJP99060.1 DUF4244 domain-containing protein [Streptomyces zingiberis]